MNDHEKLPMKVALVLAHLPHYRYGVFKELEARIAEVAFIAGENSQAGNIATIPSGSFKLAPKVRNWWIGPTLWQSGIGSALKKYNPEAVIFTGDASYLSTWVNAIIARMRGRKVYFWTIGWHKPDKGIRRIVRLAFYHLANGLLIYGSHGRALGISAGYPENRMTIVYNSFHSLAADERQVLTHGSLPDGSRPVIGAVIRLSPSKGLAEVVESIAYLRDHHNIEADGLIVGEGPARSELESLASKLGVRLFMPGAMYDQEDLEAVYRKLTVTVVPKAAGLTVLQSLAAGTPVVTIADPYQQMPEFEAIEDGVTGTLVEKADGESIATACAAWIQKLADDREETEKACRLAISNQWSAFAQGSRIVEALRISPKTGNS